MWLHHGGAAPGEKFHTNAGAGLQNFSIRGSYASRIGIGRVKKRKNIYAVKAGQAPQCCDGSGHLATFQRAQKSDRDVGRACHLRQRGFASQSQTPQTRTHWARLRTAARVWQHFLSFQQMYDGRGIHSTRAPQELRTFQDAKVGGRVHTIAAAGAYGRNQSKILPRAKNRWRNSHNSRDVANAQLAVGARFLRRTLVRRSQLNFPLTTRGPSSKVPGL